MADIDIFGSFTLQTNFCSRKICYGSTSKTLISSQTLHGRNLYRTCTNILEGYSQIKYEIIKKEKEK